MTRYFFNVHDGRHIIDEIGTDLPDIAAVRQEAVRSATDLLHANRDIDLWNGQEWKMVVTDGDGAEVLTLRFSGSSRE